MVVNLLGMSSGGISVNFTLLSFLVTVSHPLNIPPTTVQAAESSVQN